MELVMIAFLFIMPAFFAVWAAVDWLIYSFPHWWYHKKREWGFK